MSVVSAEHLNFSTSAVSQTADDMRALSSSLFQLGIGHVGYAATTGKQYYEILTTHPSFSENFVKHKLHRECFGGAPQEYCEGYAFLDDIDCDIMRQFAIQSEGFYHGLLIIKKEENKLKHFFFYLNHLDQLNQFVRHFDHTAFRLLSKAKRQLIFYPGASDKTCLVKKEFQAILPSPNHENQYTALSKAEKIVARHLILGMGCKQISKSLFRSTRTIEKHIASIRQKMSCKNQLELLVKLNEREI